MSAETPKSLQFKPLTPGLGFHPFSDGLPYAPVTKNRPTPPSPQAPMGSGAVSAGPAVFVPPARPQIPSRIMPEPRVPVTATPQAAPIAQPAPLAEPTIETFGFVYLLKRIFALALDSILNIGLVTVAFSLALYRQGLEPEALLNPGMVLLTALFLLFFNWALITAQEIAFGTTFGKRAMGLKIEGTASAIFLRAFFFIPSLGFCGLGLAWSVFDRRKRCWHDVAADVQPREIAEL